VDARSLTNQHRLARAVHLDAKPLGNGAWLITGGTTDHRVGPQGSECDCADWRVRGGPCKHVLAVQLRLGDVETIRALRTIVPLPSPGKVGGKVWSQTDAKASSALQGSGTARKTSSVQAGDQSKEQ
jgi:hypothetical protein